VTLTFRLDDEARSGWDRAADECSVTKTALVEAIGRLLNDDPDILPPEAFELARKIDRERRNR
jgi:hypothetical protein